MISLKQNHPEVIHFRTILLGTYFYRFNLEEPPFDDVRVRLAFNLATDRQAIVEKGNQRWASASYVASPTREPGLLTQRSRFRFDPRSNVALIQDYLEVKKGPKLTTQD